MWYNVLKQDLEGCKMPDKFIAFGDRLRQIRKEMGLSHAEGDLRGMHQTKSRPDGCRWRETVEHSPAERTRAGAARLGAVPKRDSTG